ncbi:MAG: hypothetical protein ABR541_06775 [Candidatus Dormibacteria bacterium]
MRRTRERWGFDLNAADAVERAAALAARSPDDSAAALLLAAALASRGEAAAAEVEAQRAAVLDPGSARALASLSSLLVARGAADEGLAAVRRAVAIDPGDVVAQYNRGLAEWTAGDRAAARDALGIAARLLDLEAPRHSPLAGVADAPQRTRRGLRRLLGRD